MRIIYGIFLAFGVAALPAFASAQTTVEITLLGSGRVFAPGLECEAEHGLFGTEKTTCTAEISEQSLTIENESPWWSALKEWGGACRGTRGSSCTLELDDAESVEIEVRFSVNELAAIALLLLAVVLVMGRVKKVDVGHDRAYRWRRVANWLPIGLLYAFLYMGRYNLKVSQRELQRIEGGLMGNEDFSLIFMIGTAIYAVSFLVNGPLADRQGGKFAILISGLGAAIMNALMGAVTWSIINQGPLYSWLIDNFFILFSVLYGANMYFQSFGAVAIVKVNAPWFHVRERGFFGAIFGILISLGIYFAYDWGGWILNHMGLAEVFAVPAALLAIVWVAVLLVVRNTPQEAGHKDFDTADASSGDDGPQRGALEVFGLMLSNPIIITIAFIEFCSGFLRQAIMQWFQTYAKQTNDVLGLTGSFVYDHWGMSLCCAGILGGVFAGVISDRFFQSRRGPVAGLLYGVMLVSAIVLSFTYQTNLTPWLVVFMSLAVIGVHGMLSGTASMDFGGRKNVGVAVGIIDGFVYAGTAFMGGTYAIILPDAAPNEAGELVGPAMDPDNWSAWPISMIPLALLGFVLALRVWNARPQPRTAQPVKIASDKPPG